MLGGGDVDFPPPFPDFVFSDYRSLAHHWPLAATAHQKDESSVESAKWSTAFIRL
jgi:hypothetical protein